MLRFCCILVLIVFLYSFMFLYLSLMIPQFANQPHYETITHLIPGQSTNLHYTQYYTQKNVIPQKITNTMIISKPTHKKEESNFGIGTIIASYTMFDLIQLIISDTRPLTVPGYHQLSFIINTRYAAQHPDLVIINVHIPCISTEKNTRNPEAYKSCVGCVHAIHGERADPLCKLLALDEIMRIYSTMQRFVYIDTDAFINIGAALLPSTYFNSSLNMFYNCPWHKQRPTCSGIIFWNAGKSAKHLVRKWSDTVTASNMIHEYEQNVFLTVFWQRNTIGISVIFEKTLVSEPNQLFQHIGHNRGDLRVV